MTLGRRKALVVLALAVGSAVVAHAWRPTKHLTDLRPRLDLEQLFPRQFGLWVQDTRGPVQLVSPDQQALLNKIYNQTLSRTYVGPQGQRVMLSVAYGGDQSDGTRAHRPDVCYPAQGFQIRSDQDGLLTVGAQQIRARKLVAQQGARVEPITYWVVVGERVALSGTEQKLAQLRYSTKGVIPDGMLVRVSTIDANAEQAYQVHQHFIQDMAGAMNGANYARVFGGRTD